MGLREYSGRHPGQHRRLAQHGRGRHGGRGPPGAGGTDRRSRLPGRLRVSTIRKLGLDGGKAALIACPRPAVLEVIHQVEKEQGLPSPTLGGQWAKTSAEVRSSWMITGLTAAREPAAFQAQRVFQTARCSAFVTW